MWCTESRSAEAMSNIESMGEGRARSILIRNERDKEDCANRATEQPCKASSNALKFLCCYLRR